MEAAIGGKMRLFEKSPAGGYDDSDYRQHWPLLFGENLKKEIAASHLFWEFESGKKLGLAGQVASRSVGPVKLGWVKLTQERDTLRGKRTSKEIASNSEPYMTIVIPIRGSIVLKTGLEEEKVSDSQFAFWTSTIPMAFEIKQATYEQFSILVPQRVLRANVRACESLHCVRVQNKNIFTDLFYAHARTLIQAIDDPFTQFEMSLTQVTTSIVDAIIDSAQASKNSTLDWLDRIKVFVDCHISDENLSPTSVSRALGISTRYIHKVFESESQTLCEWITNRRLEKSANYLLCSKLSVTEVSIKSGFKSSSHFSRMFKKNFGLSPSEYRFSRKA